MPETETIKIQVLWTELLHLNKRFSKQPELISDDEIMAFEEMSRKWVDRFTKVYPAKHVTPYIHAMCNNVGQFMKVHGGILPFTQQGMEKMNDIITKQYF